MKHGTEVLDRVRDIIFERVSVHSELKSDDMDIAIAAADKMLTLNTRLNELLWVLGVKESDLRIKLKEGP